MPFDESVECPLCMEPLDIDDMNFYPCTCGYQICRFCWHRIRTDENSLCPACRKQYQEDPAEFKPLTDEELTKIKKERRQKDMARKQKAAENRRHLANIRVVQKNLVFVVGLSNRLADAETLRRQEYFGKYGKIVKVVINSSTSYAGAQGPSASAYITYTRPEDCLRGIQAVNNLSVDGRTLKASLGTTKYCSHFLKGTQCAKTDCMYLHELGEEEASFTKEEMQAGKHQDYEQKLAELYLNPPQSSITQTPSRTTSITVTTTPVGSVNGPTTVSTTPMTKEKTSTTKKKLEGGPCTGSNKLKEPWPLLSSSRNQSAIGQGNDAVINPDGLSSSFGSQLESPELNRRNGAPSSSCSTTSNPRTPTPETSSSLSPHLPNSTVSEIGNMTTLPSLTDTVNTHSLASGPSTLLAVRKLPFTDSSPPDNISAHTDFMLTNSRNPAVFTNGLIDSNSDLKFTGFNQEIDSKTVSKMLPDWQPTINHTLASDDDLGFDPYLESNKGLADMLENETHFNSSPLCGFRSQAIKPPPPPGVPAVTSALFADGIMSPIVPPMLPVVSSSSSPLPPPPPGLSGFPQFPNASVGSNAQDLMAMRGGSRMLGLMNIGQSVNQTSMMSSSPVNNLPNRNHFSDPRISPVHPMTQAQSPFNNLHTGMPDIGSFNTQDLKESLKALLPNASINIAPSISNPQPIQQSRLRNMYMQQNNHLANRSTSWNGSNSQMNGGGGGGALDDQFTDPAIVSGCLSTDISNSPPNTQPHWLKSIQQMTDGDSIPMKQLQTSNHQIHAQHVPSPYRPTISHSRMPFAQNIHINQSGSNSGWPTLPAHNPPPGFPTAFRSTSQNPRMATLES